MKIVRKRKQVVFWGILTFSHCMFYFMGAFPKNRIDAEIASNRNGPVTFIGRSTNSLVYDKFQEPENWKSSLQYSIIIPTLNRERLLQSLLERFNDSYCPSLSKIFISWGNKSAPIPEFLSRNNAWKYPIEVILRKSDALHYRFETPDHLRTEAVFSHDDDLEIHCDDLEVAFQAWRQFPGRIVGFVSRRHEFDGKSFKYSLPSPNCEVPWYSMVLTGASFLHRNWLQAFFKDNPPEIMRYLSQNNNCEDIAMNFLVAHELKKPPIYVSGRVISYVDGIGGISNKPGHILKRNECLNHFSQWYGYMPLDSSKSSLKIVKDTKDQMSLKHFIASP